MGSTQVLIWLIRLCFAAPVPTALFGFAWAVKIDRLFDAAGWLVVASLFTVFVVRIWRMI